MEKVEIGDATLYCGDCNQIIPLTVIVSLMGEMAEHQLGYRAVLARIQIEPNKPRGGAGKGRFGGAKQIDLHLQSDS